MSEGLASPEDGEAVCGAVGDGGQLLMDDGGDVHPFLGIGQDSLKQMGESLTAGADMGFAVTGRAGDGEATAAHGPSGGSRPPAPATGC